MLSPNVKKLLLAVLFLAAGWVAIRWLLPVLLPFLLGGLLALAAEPAVSFGVRRLHLRRGLAAGIGVSLTLVFLSGLILMVAAGIVRQLGRLSAVVPDLESGAAVLKDWLVSAADSAPERVRVLAQRTVLEFFDDGTAVMRGISDRIPGMLSGLVTGAASSVLSIGTGLLAAFLISIRLPRLRRQLAQWLPESWYTQYLPALRKLRSSLLGWLKAQGKLALVTWGVVFVGFVVLRIPYAAVWSALVALVDAVPILGTGTVLVPWSVVRFLQGDNLQGVGLLCIYGAAAVTRTVLEPKLIGRQLGLDPLATLVALYVGFRFWGIPGLLVTPILASAGKTLLAEGSFFRQHP